MRSRRPPRRGVVVRLAAFVAALTGLFFVSIDGSAAASTFSASAGGEIARSVVKLVPALLQEELLDPGAVTAQASLTSFGESKAFASNPFPGSLAVSAPGLIDGLFGMTPGVPPELLDVANLPEYPLLATSTHPAKPSGSVSAGTLILTAESRERESTGIATDGVNRTKASVTADGSDVVTARATSEVGAVDVGPLVTLSGVRSEAQVVQSAGGELERSTDFSVASFSVLGQQLRVGDDGLEVVGLNLPGGLGGVVDPVQQLLAPLADQGIRIEFVEATETPEGIISAGVILERTFDTGVNGIVATVTTTLGRTFANVSNRARPPVGGGGLTTGPFPSGSSVAPGNTAFGPSASPGSILTPPATPPAAAGTTGTAAPAEEQRISALVPELIDSGRFYPVLVFGGAVFILGISLFRKIGVRTTWT